MDKLRNIALAMLMVIILLSVAGIVLAFYEMWAAALGLVFGTVIISAITTLVTARYIARNDRTGEQRTKSVTQKLAARVKDAVEQQEKTTTELQTLIQSASESQEQTHARSQQLLTDLTTSVAKIESNLTSLNKAVAESAKTTRRHLATAMRDSTRQVESIVHLYERYPEVKLPMPNTGGFAIDSQALAHLIALVEERQPRRILELGSGTSTIWLGYLCRSFGGKLVTLDHLEHYLELTRTAIRRHQLTDVIESRLAPLEPTLCNGTEFNWYATTSMEDLSDIDMVIIDGPPAATGPQARYPALPKVLEMLTPTATVILDDAHRNEEAEIVESWLTDYADFKEIEHGTSRLAVLQRVAS